MGLSLRNLARDNSYGADYLDDARTYFTAYGPQVALVFTRAERCVASTCTIFMEQTLANPGG